MIYLVKFNGNKLTPVALNAKNPIDAAIKLMQAQPDEWKRAPQIATIEVFDADGSHRKLLYVRDLLKLLPPEQRNTQPARRTQRKIQQGQDGLPGYQKS